jgi:hypothetical protein
LRRALCAAALLACVFSVEHARADDPYATAKRDVIAAQDFRVRVASALALGKSKDAAARAPLEKALGDGHPAVRSASAAALGALGDKDAIPSLERALASDSSDSVKSQIRTSLDRLKGTGAAAVGAPVSLSGVQIVVQLGSMRNGTTVRGEQLAQVLRSATKSKAQSIPHVAVAEVGDTALLKQAADKKLPIVALDGAVLKLAQGQSGQTITFQAQVEYSLRRVSDQSLKGLLTGSASAFDSSRALSNQQRVAELQDQAVQAAVESALRGADKSMALAVR